MEFSNSLTAALGQADVDFMETPPGKQRLGRAQRRAPLLNPWPLCTYTMGAVDMGQLTWQHHCYGCCERYMVRMVWMACGDHTAPYSPLEEESKKPGSFLANVQQQLLDLEKGGAEDKSNEWEMVFDKTTINATNGLRLPYNDKASLKPTDEEKAGRRDWPGTGKRGKNESFTMLGPGTHQERSAAKKIRVIEGRPSKAIGVSMADS
eukprot:Skav224155  [mRNA]  locus=scaffold2488:76799:80047:- [translate_table: standard]